MGLSIWQLLIIALVVLVLFGRGRISEMMGDFGKGIKSFKQGMNEDETPSAKSPAQIEGRSNDVNASADAKPAERSDKAK